MKKLSMYILTALLSLVVVPAIKVEAKTAVKETVWLDENRYELREVEQDADLDEVNVSYASNKTLTVKNPNRPDAKGPTFKGLKLSGNKFYALKEGEDTLTCTLKVSDSIAGFDYGYINFLNPKNKRDFGVYISSEDCLSPNEYEGSYTFSGIESGTYECVSVILYDKAGNYTFLSADKKNGPKELKNISITVKKKATGKTASISSFKAKTDKVTFKPTQLHADIRMKVDLKANKGKVNAINFELEQTDKNVTERMGAYVEVSGDGTIKFDMGFVNEKWNYGEWRFAQMTVFFTDGDTVVINRKSKIPDELKNFKVTVTGKEYKPKEQKFPVVSNIEFIDKTVKLSSNPLDFQNVYLKVKGSSKSKEGISDIRVSFENKKTGKLMYGEAYYEEGAKSGNKKIAIPLSKYLNTSEWRLYDIEIRNMEGYMTNYSRSCKKVKITGTFCVRPLPTFAKDMKIKVVNTYK